MRKMDWLIVKSGDLEEGSWRSRRLKFNPPLYVRLKVGPDGEEVSSQ